MTQEFSFKYYIENYNNITAYQFKTFFNESLEKLPNNIVSSKKLITILNINTKLKKEIFQNAFLDYFKEKLKYIV